MKTKRYSILYCWGIVPVILFAGANNAVGQVPLPVDVINYTQIPGLFTASTNRATDWGEHENITRIIDGEAGTKFGTGERPLPGDPLIIFLNTTDDRAVPVSRYALTTANDSPDRDPLSWIFYGSDNGINWVELNTVIDSLFTGDRFATYYFELDTVQVFSHFKFDFLSNKGAEGFQLAEIGLYGLYGEVPEPATVGMFLAGLAGVLFLRGKRRGTK